MTIAILGAGPHGHQLQRLIPESKLYDDELPSWRTIDAGARNHQWVVGAAWPKVRRHIVTKVETIKGYQPAALLYNEHYGEGTVIYPGAQISEADVVVKDHAHIEFNSVVSHGCTIGNFVTICPNATLAGEVTLNDGVFIGAGATIIHGGIEIGIGAIIGAGAVVLRDVPQYTVVAGNPARHIKDLERVRYAPLSTMIMGAGIW